MEEIGFILDSAKEKMEYTIEHLNKVFLQIRAGKAHPAMLNSVLIDYYGSQTPLSQVANINTTDAMTLSVQPWEKKMLPEIERGIMMANLGLNPMNNGEVIMNFLRRKQFEAKCFLFHTFLCVLQRSRFINRILFLYIRSYQFTSIYAQ